MKIDENEYGIKSLKYFEFTSDGKNLLRSAMSKYMPISTINIKKQGFFLQKQVGLKEKV